MSWIDSEYLGLLTTDPQAKLRTMMVERLYHGDKVVPGRGNKGHVIGILKISDVSFMGHLPTVANQIGVQMVCYLNAHTFLVEGVYC